MSYGDFGLDETKKSTDGPGSKGAKYCLWCAKDVKTGFSICFQHFVICEECAMSATEVKNNERWHNADQCDKCRVKVIIGLRSHRNILDWFICKKCIDWAKSMFLKNKTRRKAKYIFFNIKNNNMQANAEFQKVISDHLDGLAANDQLFAETLKKPGKNIKDCCTYIMNTVKKSGRNWLPDSEVFGMAVHYYDEDTIDVGAPVAAKIVTSATVEKTAPKPSAKKAEKKEVKQQPSLF